MGDVGWVVVLGWLAAVVVIVRMIPQPVRLVRTGVPHGVSALAVINIALTELAWIVYGLRENLVPVWALSLVAFPAGLWTVYLLRDRITRRDLLGAAVWSAAIVLGTLTGTLALALAFSVVVNYGPQVVTAIRGSRLEGLAPATWYLALADAGLWGAYGLAVGDPALIGYCAALASAAVVILARIAHERSSPATVEPALTLAVDTA
jgi:uncharacterized protein with PQ loop repeat